MTFAFLYGLSMDYEVYRMTDVIIVGAGPTGLPGDFAEAVAGRKERRPLQLRD